MPQTLFTPGPTPVPLEVIERMSQPIIHHRSDRAKEIFKSVHSMLAQAFMTEQPVLILTSSGTGAIEAAMTTLCSTGETAIVLNNGKFATRWAEMLRVFGVNVVQVDIEWGDAVMVQTLEKALMENPNCATVWMVQSETSTGVFSDVKPICEFVHNNSNALVCVDGVSSVCVHELRMDDWGVDVLATGSQKGLMLPPGLSFVALSERAWERAHRSNNSSFYFDLRKARKSHLENTTPWTPAISLVCGLETSLMLILNEGLENVWKRHGDITRLLRTRLTEEGYSLFSRSPSHAVTSVNIPASKPDIVRSLYRDFGIQVASGQDKLKGKIFRIGHLGQYTTEDIEFVTEALSSMIR